MGGIHRELRSHSLIASGVNSTTRPPAESPTSSEEVSCIVGGAAAAGSVDQNVFRPSLTEQFHL